MTRGTDITSMKRSYRTVTGADIPDKVVILLQRENELRYGENPMQGAAQFMIRAIAGNKEKMMKEECLADLVSIELSRAGGKSGWSATNYMDVTKALDVLKFFEEPSVAVMKHLVPSGFATQHEGNSLADIYRKARDADARSAFGSVVVFNRPVDVASAEAVMESYVECVVAPSFEEGTTEIFEKKKDIRVITYDGLDDIPKYKDDDVEGIFDMKVLPGGRAILQQPYVSSIRGPEDLITDPYVMRKKVAQDPVARDPTEAEIKDMLTAWYVNVGGVRSNGIVVVKDGVTVSVGSGQQERVGAVEQAIVKGYQKAMDREGVEYNPLYGISNINELDVDPFDGAVLSSDAFFPFRDSIDRIADVGMKAIIQPFGSVRDHEVIKALNEYDMAAAVTLERCFSHH